MRTLYPVLSWSECVCIYKCEHLHAEPLVVGWEVNARGLRYRDDDGLVVIILIRTPEK